MDEACRECGFDALAATPADVAGALAPLAQEIADTVRAISQPILRRRPAPRVWSPQEYLGHLRESMAFHRWLIERGLSERNPVIGAVDPDASVEQAGYRSSATEDLIGQFQRRVDRLRDVLVTLDNDATRRTLTLDDFEITLALVARSAWHECHHHLGDIRRITAQTR
jgi:hypothetical protein